MKPTSPMSDAQRRVLERLDAGEMFVFSPATSPNDTRSAWFPNDENEKTKYIHMATFDALAERGWVGFGGYVNRSARTQFVEITDEGRKAVNERPGE